MINRRAFLPSLDASRRSFLRASLAVACMPMIVRASILMKVRALPKFGVIRGTDIRIAGDYFISFPFDPRPMNYWVFDGSNWQEFVVT